MSTLPIGKGEVRRDGTRVAILAFGTLLHAALAVADRVDATVANMRFVKPLDEALVLDLARTHELLVTLEENSVVGGAGSGVAECLAAHGVAVPLLQLGLPDRHADHGTRDECLRDAGLDVEGLFDAITNRIAHGRTQAGRARGAPWPAIAARRDAGFRSAARRLGRALLR
jgi:1-deoxy-D-xylulose-5-phosphate synthase